MTDMTEYALLLMDILDAKNGRYRNLSQIHRRFPASELPKIIASRHMSYPGVRKKCLEAGMIDYILKPMSLNELDAILMKYPEEPVRRQ